MKNPFKYFFLPITLSLLIFPIRSYSEPHFTLRKQRPTSLYRESYYAPLLAKDQSYNETLKKFDPTFVDNQTSFEVSLDNTPLIKTTLHLKQLQKQHIGSFLGLANKQLTTLQIIDPQSKHVIVEKSFRSLHPDNPVYFRVYGKRYRIQTHITTAPILVKHSNHNDPEHPKNWNDGPIILITIQEYF